MLSSRITFALLLLSEVIVVCVLSLLLFVPNHPATCWQELRAATAAMPIIIFFMPRCLQRLCLLARPRRAAGWPHQGGNPDFNRFSENISVCQTVNLVFAPYFCRPFTKSHGCGDPAVRPETNPVLHG